MKKIEDFSKRNFHVSPKEVSLLGGNFYFLKRKNPMANKKYLIFTLLLASVFLITFVSSSDATYCCERTKGGARCVNAPLDDCVDGTNSAPTFCESTSYCKSGTCYDTAEGICMGNTPKAVCDLDESSTWDPRPMEEIPQCQLGCCIMADQAAFVPLTRCKHLSRIFNVENDYRTDITDELTCIATAQSQDKGACVYESEFERVCDFTTRTECGATEGGTFDESGNAIITSEKKFFKDYLCSAPELATSCTAQLSTTCHQGKVYWVDSCGNLENVYLASDYEAVNERTSRVQKPDDIAPKSNGDDINNGNCDYILGTRCAEYDRPTGGPTHGSSYCRKNVCIDRQGNERLNGEAWCVVEGVTTGVADDRDDLENVFGTESLGNGKDRVGSRYYREVCSNGEIVVEPCADFRNEICIEGSIDTDEGEFSTAACRVNKWQDCITQIYQEDCKNTGKRDCVWTDSVMGLVLGTNGTTGETNRPDGICVPSYPPGLEFWKDSTADDVCGNANAVCTVTYKKRIGDLLGQLWAGESNYEDDVPESGSECIDGTWAIQANRICTSLGDCGGFVNYAGEYTDDGYVWLEDQWEEHPERRMFEDLIDIGEFEVGCENCPAGFPRSAGNWVPERKYLEETEGVSIQDIITTAVIAPITGRVAFDVSGTEFHIYEYRGEYVILQEREDTPRQLNDVIFAKDGNDNWWYELSKGVVILGSSDDDYAANNGAVIQEFNRQRAIAEGGSTVEALPAQYHSIANEMIEEVEEAADEKGIQTNYQAVISPQMSAFTLNCEAGSLRHGYESQPIDGTTYYCCDYSGDGLIFGVSTTACEAAEEPTEPAPPVEPTEPTPPADTPPRPVTTPPTDPARNPFDIFMAPPEEIAAYIATLQSLGDRPAVDAEEDYLEAYRKACQNGNMQEGHYITNTEDNDRKMYCCEGTLGYTECSDSDGNSVSELVFLRSNMENMCESGHPRMANGLNIARTTSGEEVRMYCCNRNPQETPCPATQYTEDSPLNLDYDPLGDNPEGVGTISNFNSGCEDGSLRDGYAETIDGTRWYCCRSEGEIRADVPCTEASPYTTGGLGPVGTTLALSTIMGEEDFSYAEEDFHSLLYTLNDDIPDKSRGLNEDCDVFDPEGDCIGDLECRDGKCLEPGTKIRGEICANNRECAKGLVCRRDRETYNDEEKRCLEQRVASDILSDEKVAPFLSGAAWASGAFTAVQTVAPMLGVDPQLTDTLSLSISTATFVAKTLSDGAAVWDNGQFFTNNPLLWGAIAGAGMFALTYQQEENKTVQFTCMPWSAPVGGDNCELCNGDLPCSEYKCRSLGLNCEIVNEGTEDELCVNVNPQDTNPPIIVPDDQVITSGFEYSDYTASPPSPGFKIVHNGGKDSCIPAFTPIEFGVYLDEPAQCKLDLESTSSFEEMRTYFGGRNTYDYYHEELLSLPSIDDLEESGAITIENSQDLTLYMRCQDRNGNSNDAEYAIQLCIDDSPDTIAPIIQATSVQDGGCIAEDQSSAEVKFYTDEPADCKWSTQDQNYESMNNIMTNCGTQKGVLFSCTANLTGIPIDGKDFYVRCQDRADEETGKNVMMESFPFTLHGSTGLLMMDFQPNGSETIYGGVDPMPVELRVETAMGCSSGLSTCYYATEEPDTPGDYIQFFDTYNEDTIHTQTLYLDEGDHEIFVRCLDDGGNEVTDTTYLSLDIDEEAPVITRVYEDAGLLKVITLRESECVYTYDSCDFTFDDGIEMPYPNSTIHVAEWSSDKTFYIKCRDEFKNIEDDCSMIVRPTKNFL